MPAGYQPFYSLQNASGEGAGFVADVGVSSEPVTMEIFITGSATVLVEASADGVAWIDVSSGGYTASQTVDLESGIPYYRARIGSYTSGYVSAIIGPGRKPDGTMVNIGPDGYKGYATPQPPVGPPFVGNPTPDWFNVLDYGAIAGTTDNTAAYDAIFNNVMPATGGVLFFPAGHFTGTINCPDTPNDRSSNVHVIGSGISTTWLHEPSADTGVIKKGNRTGVIQGTTIGGFTIKAHASSAGTVDGIDGAGFRSCRFYDIGAFSNGTGNFRSVIRFSAGEMRCYHNTVSHLVINGSAGPATVVRFDEDNDAGVNQSLNYSANECVIEDLFVYDNTGITTGIDALRSDGTTIRHCFWESNPGCTYVIPGNGTKMYNNNYESGAAVDMISFTSVGGQGAGNQVLSIADSFANTDPMSITFHDVTDCRIINPRYGTSVTWANDGAARNNLVTIGSRILGVVPSFANNAAAVTGGLLVGDRYYVTGSDPRVLAVVS